MINRASAPGVPPNRFSRAGWVIAALLGAILAGCGATIHPPQDVADPVVVFVKLDARHSAVVLPRDDAGGRYVEYSFGAWRWFAYGDTRWPVAVGSLLGFMQSTLQSQEYPAGAAGPGTAPDVPSVRYLRFEAERERVEALRDELDARFRQNIDTFHYNSEYDMTFVQDDEHYWVFNNCNQVTARWVRQLGAPVRGWALTNQFRLSGD